MAISIRLDENFVSDVKIYAEAASRSAPKQIVHWIRTVGSLKKNPDSPFSGFVDCRLYQ